MFSSRCVLRHINAKLMVVGLQILFKGYIGLICAVMTPNYRLLEKKEVASALLEKQVRVGRPGCTDLRILPSQRSTLVDIHVGSCFKAACINKTNNKNTTPNDTATSRLV